MRSPDADGGGGGGGGKAGAGNWGYLRGNASPFHTFDVMRKRD